LSSDETLLEGKIIIINTLFVYSQQNRTGSFELDRARLALEKKYANQLKQLITHVMTTGLDTYLPKTGKSIYDYEENYMYATYQMWSGDADDTEGIKKIREVASFKL